MNPRYTKYRRALRLLRRDCPADMPVRVRLNHGPNPLNEEGCPRESRAYAVLSLDGESYTIVIRTRYGRRLLTREELEDVLVHEWAHPLSWNSLTPHGGRWGQAYAECYRAVVEGEQ